MGTPKVPDEPASRPNQGFSAGVRSALRLLWEACRQARQEEDLWQFAINLAEVHEAGATSTDLRRLVHDGLVEYRVECTAARTRRRQFQEWHNLSLPHGSCFILTKPGIAVAEQILSEDASANAGERASGERSARFADRPGWDRALRILSCGDKFRKVFRQVAPRQTLILEAFEEQGWPERIDDPLPREQGMDRIRLLRDTLRNLNRTLRGWPIRFAADGTKRGIRWQRVV